MNYAEYRDLISFGVIVLAIVVGAEQMFVSPRMNGVHENEARVNGIARQVGAGIDVVALDRRKDTLRNRIDEIDALNQHAADASRLYNELWECCRAAGVQVDRINPGAAMKDGENVRRFTYQVTFRGTFESLTTFLEQIDALEAPHRIVAFRASPVPLERPNAVPMLSAQVDVGFFEFVVPDDLLKSPEERGSDGTN